jgi:hypothetical protein
VGAEGAASKEALPGLNGGDFAAAIIHPEHQILGIGIFFDVHFPEGNTPVLQEILGAATVRAPGGAVNHDLIHESFGSFDEMPPGR